MLKLEPVILEGQFAKLIPLETEHCDALFAQSREDFIWRFKPYTAPATPELMAEHVTHMLAQRDAGIEMPFTVIRQSDQKIVGSTRYLEIRLPHRGLEIGSTWYASEARRTPINTECKLLLMTHAFENLGMIRVQLRTDARNEASRNAILRIGAQFEGILRKHVVMPDGYLRDTAFYSVTFEEWPEVKRRLGEMLEPRD